VKGVDREAAKGVALAIVGVLFIVAAVTFDPQKAGGLDTALQTPRQRTFGPVLLALTALGGHASDCSASPHARSREKT